MKEARTPHICFVAPNAYPLLADDFSSEIIGGAELQQVIIAKELVARGYAVSMICLDFGQADAVLVHGITVFKACRWEAGMPILRFFHPRLSSFWSCLRRANADIYYIRTATPFVGLVAAFGKKYRKKTVFAASGNTDFSMTDSKIRYARDRLLYRFGVRNSTRIVAQSEEQQRQCKDNYGRDATIIRNCVPEVSGTSSQEPDKVLWASTIRSVKRPEMFVQLATLLPDIKFVMVGGIDHYEAQLYESIQELAGQQDNLDFVGFVPYRKIGSYFRNARVFVNTSVTEGFPNTFLQAWSNAVPTVSFFDCGAREGSEPVGCHVTSVEEMADAIWQLFADDDEYMRVGMMCKSYCMDHHSLSAVMMEYETLIESLLKEYEST